MKKSTSPHLRPGGRSSEVALRVQKAVRHLLETQGYRGVSYQAVSEQARVGRATLYRRWPTRPELALFAISGAVADAVTIADQGTLEGDLRETLGNIAVFIRTSLGRASIAAIFEMEDATEFHRTLWRERAVEVSAIFERARARGDILHTPDTEAIFAMAAGSLYFRMIVAGASEDETWVDRVTSQCMTLLRQKTPQTDA